MTLPPDRPDRKQRFRAALALAGMTQEQFAEEHGVTASHLSRVMSGERESQSLWAQIDAFIDARLPPPPAARRKRAAA